MKALIRTLEQDKMAYQKTVEQIRKLLPADVLANCELLLRDLSYPSNDKAKTGNKPQFQSGVSIEPPYNTWNETPVHCWSKVDQKSGGTPATGAEIISR